MRAFDCVVHVIYLAHPSTQMVIGENAIFPDLGGLIRNLREASVP